ncbi:MAG TPA: Sua5 family C-terminal domain-containing protein, partial [Burkholderiaceae bacterium]|nr:Sua5 family C-terminal domain-containing protein [Burkholderiaceae bacterium]
RVSPTTAAHVAQEFGDLLWVLDGGPCEVGIESSIVDCTRGHAVLLRPGMLTRELIEAAAGESLLDRDAAAPRASGTLASHYAPRATVQLVSSDVLQSALAQCGEEEASGLAVYSRTLRPDARPDVLMLAMPADAALAAQELFSVLRDLDALGVQRILVEQPPDTPEWEGVRDRLQRAAAAR